MHNTKMERIVKVIWGSLEAFTQGFKKVGKVDNPNILKMFQREKMLVPADNKVSFGV